MEEFFGAILGALAELLIEFLFELLVEGILDLFLRSVRSFFSNIALSSAVACAFYLLLGGGVGATSLLLFPHPIIHPSKFHGISLLISPLATGLVMWQVGALLRRHGKQPVRIESFGYGFAFAFGMAAVRLLFAH